MYSNIKNAIKALLTAITTIKNVYGYEKGNLDGYPSAVVTLESIECVYETNNEDERKYAFKVKVYQEMVDDALGAETAETTIEALIDTVLGKFENDYTLGGLCHKVNINGVAGYVDRGINMRVLEFTVNCYALYTLT
jgi:hypothetical protein